MVAHACSLMAPWDQKKNSDNFEWNLFINSAFIITYLLN